MTRLVGLWLTLLIFLGGPALVGKVCFGDFTIAAETNGANIALGSRYGGLKTLRPT